MTELGPIARCRREDREEQAARYAAEDRMVLSLLSIRPMTVERIADALRVRGSIPLLDPALRCVERLVERGHVLRLRSGPCLALVEARHIGAVRVLADRPWGLDELARKGWPVEPVHPSTPLLLEDFVNAKDQIIAYLRQNPGAYSCDILDAAGLKRSSSRLHDLHRQGLIRSEEAELGPSGRPRMRWWLVSPPSAPAEPVSDPAPTPTTAAPIEGSVAAVEGPSLASPRREPPWDELDAGIVSAVRLLWDAGFQTTDSGDGSKWPAMECAVAWPMVFCVVAPDDVVESVDRIASLPWETIGRPDPSVEGTVWPGGAGVSVHWLKGDDDVVAAEDRAMAAELAHLNSEIADAHAALDDMPATRAPDLTTPGDRIRHAARAWKDERAEADRYAALCQEAHDVLDAAKVARDGTPAARIRLLVERADILDAERRELADELGLIAHSRADESAAVAALRRRLRDLEVAVVVGAPDIAAALGVSLG